MTNSTSPQSNPPAELVEAYRQIGEARGLVDNDNVENNLGLDGIRAGQLSPGTARRYGNESPDPFAYGDADFLDNVTNGSPHRKHSDYIKDERRLRRATTSQSPVFSRARTGIGSGLTSEDLQRRDEEIQEDFPEMEVEDDDRGPEPSYNFPSTWGSRATNRRNWMRNIGRRIESSSRNQVDQAADDPTPKSRLKFDTGATSLARNTGSSPRRTGLETRSVLRERSTSGYNRTVSSDEHNKPGSEQKEQQSTEGGQSSNTPVSIYKSSTFNKRSPTKRDSHDLLRKLSRAESPRVNSVQNENQIQTPEPAKQPERPIYDKTPVVTGAWIDTPMTEKVTQPPEHLSRDIVPSPPRRKEPEYLPQPIELHTEKQPPPQPEPSRERERDPAKETRAEKGEQKEQEKEKEKSTEKKKEPEKSKPPVIKPNLPKSGLEAYLRDSKTNENPPGDDTLESLDLILNEQQPAEVKSEAEQDAEYEKAILKKLERASPDEPAKNDVEKIDDNLVSLGKRINEIKAGIASLEEKFNREGKHIHSGEDCSTCGDDRLYASIPLPYLWRRDPATRRIRPTRLTWFLLLFLIWLFSESTMCDQYCHPTFATACNGNCLKPDAPQFPFVIPTMLWRWSHLSSFLTPIFTLALAFFKLTMQLLGLWDGYMDDGPPRTLDPAGEIRIHGTRVSGFPSATSTPVINSPPQQWPVQYGQSNNPGLGVPPWEDDQSSMDDDELL